MANPNRTVAKYRQRVGFPPRPRRELEPFMVWLCEQARSGATFKSLEEATDAYVERARVASLIAEQAPPTE